MKLLKPLDKWFVTQPFAANPQIYVQFGLKGHNGIDLRTRFFDSPLGRRFVTASAAGVVSDVRYDLRGYGIHIRLRHPDGSMTLYGHLTKPYVQKGDSIQEGQKIALTGNTGFSTGSHLHFEYRDAGWEKIQNNGWGGAVDPLLFLK